MVAATTQGDFSLSSDRLARLGIDDCDAVFQPIFDAKTGHIKGFETLARPIMPDGSLGHNPTQLIEDITADGKNTDLYFHMLKKGLLNFQML